MILTMMLGAALANDVPEDEPEPVRDVNTGFGLGVAWLGTNPGSNNRLGLHVDFRSEAPLSRAFQFNFLLAAGLTTPENTVAMFQWGTGAGRSITHAFGDVHDWARRGRDHDLGGLREAGALFAYMGLGFSYLVVPVVWVLSPFASIGHALLGPTISWHTSARAPDAYVEAGVGGLLYGDLAEGGPGLGFGPMIGAGGHVGKQTVGVRLLVSPPALHAELGPSTDTIVSGAFVVTL